MITQPIIFVSEENTDDIEAIKTAIIQRKDKQYLLDYPTVYIHYWKNGEKEEKYSAYVGESNNIIERTKQHFDASNDHEKWQSKLKENKPEIVVIGYEHFNKSLTLDVENRMIQYLLGAPTITMLFNGRGNPQHGYYPNELDQLFPIIWKKLQKQNAEVFPAEEIIKNSALFKASPFHKLTVNQTEAKEIILNKIHEALLAKKEGQLIFVEGEAGSGKTVLTSNIFFNLELLEDDEKLKCHLLVNHDEQVGLYKEMAKKLHIVNIDDTVCKPTHFIQKLYHNTNEKADVVFIDEAHLLLTQGKQAYQGKNQLEDIRKKARVTVIMFDENQTLRTQEYWENNQIEKLKEEARTQNQYITLRGQLRMEAGKQTIEWIDNLTKKHIVTSLPRKDEKGYEVRFFDSPIDLHSEIEKKAKNKETSLSRIIATYDWPYSNNPNSDDEYWNVTINDDKGRVFSMPWNYQRKVEKKEKTLSWAEQSQTLNEIGSTFTIQGFDLSYAGVIIGPSIGYENGRIIFNPEYSANDKATNKRTLSNGEKIDCSEELLSHELRVLLTRGVKGLFIYACDPSLRKALKDSIK